MRGRSFHRRAIPLQVRVQKVEGQRPHGYSALGKGPRGDHRGDRSVPAGEKSPEIRLNDQESCRKQRPLEKTGAAEVRQAGSGSFFE